jgi:hypothetical protein
VSTPHKALCAATVVAGWFTAGLAAAAPVTYTAFMVTDVSLNGQHFHNAPVTLTFVGDTANVHTFSVTASDGKSASGWEITKGAASVQIINGIQVIQATFLPGQILVALDSENGGAGFSSLVGVDHHLEPGYPLAMTGTTIWNLPDLVTTGRWSGHAWSCIGYPPHALKTGRCGNAASYPLSTSRGPFVMFMPYYATDAAGTIVDDYEAALNDATFSVLVGP